MPLSVRVNGTKISLKQEIGASKMLKDHFQLNQLTLNYDNPKDFLQPLVSIPLQSGVIFTLMQVVFAYNL